jgi:hypothetical protein
MYPLATYYERLQESCNMYPYVDNETHQFLVQTTDVR